MRNIDNLFLNEIQIDLFWREKLNIFNKGINYRPMKYKKLNSFIYYYYVLVVFWIPILTAANIYFFLASLKIKKLNIINLKNEKIWINSSIKSESIKKLQALEDCISIDIRKKEYFCYLSRYERLRLLFVSLWSIWFKSSLSVSNKLHLLDLYRVQCFFEFILKINIVSTELHLSNHYDRWAMSCYKGYSRGVELWQHGVLDDSIVLDIKLTNISKIHCLSAKDVIWWKNNIANENTEFSIQKNLFKLTANQFDIDILIVSNFAYINEELDVLNVCLAHPKLKELKFAYKPHPVYGRNYILSNLSDEVLVLGKNEYPYAKLVVHKGSTLGQEYESIGVRVYDSINKEKAEVVSDIIKLTDAHF